MKITKLDFTFFTFLCLLIYAFYLYSLRLDYLPWGSRQRDGLFFLSFYLFILPSLLINAALKKFFLKKTGSLIYQNSFFMHIALICIPALDIYGSQLSLLIGVIFCLIGSILVLGEFYFLRIRARK